MLTDTFHSKDFGGKLSVLCVLFLSIYIYYHKALKNVSKTGDSQNPLGKSERAVKTPLVCDNYQVNQIV